MINKIALSYGDTHIELTFLQLAIISSPKWKRSMQHFVDNTTQEIYNAINKIKKIKKKKNLIHQSARQHASGSQL